MQPSENKSTTTSSSSIPMGSIFSFLTGFLLGAAGAAAGVAYVFFYGAQHLGPLIKKNLEEAEKEQLVVLKAITNRGESIVYPLTGINTTPPIHRLGETNLCLRMNGGILSIYQPERNSASGVSKHRSASIMQVLAQFHVDRIIVHSVHSRRIEIEAISAASDAICDVSFGTISVPAHRISIDFVYRHEAAEVFSRCLAGGAGAVGSSVFLRQAYRHVPAYYKFLSSLPQKKLTPATILLSRVLGSSNDVRALKPFILSKLRKKLDKVKLPSPVKGTIEVADLKLGNNSPAIGDIRVVNEPLNPDDGSLELAVDIEYSGGFELALTVEIEVDSFISVKVPSITVTIKVNQLKGVLRVLSLPPPCKNLWIAFETTPDIKIGFQQQINGANSIMKTLASKIPDLSEIVTDVVKSSLLNDMVLPNRDDISLPIIGDTPPNTPAEPENDASIFEQFREKLPRSVREKGKNASAASPIGSDSGSPNLMNSNATTKNVQVGRNFQDDDIIFNATGGSSSGGLPPVSPMPPANALPQKKTVHISGDVTRDLHNIDTTVSARAKADAEKMRRDQEEKEAKEKEAADKKKAEEPSLIDRFLSTKSDPASNQTQQQQQQQTAAKAEEKGFFGKISDKYHEYEDDKKKQREEEEKKKKEAAAAAALTPATEDKGIFDKLSDKYREFQHQREEDEKKKQEEEAAKKKKADDDEAAKKKKMQEEEATKKRQQEEEEAQKKKKLEEEATKKKQLDDEVEAAKKRKQQEAEEEEKEAARKKKGDEDERKQKEKDVAEEKKRIETEAAEEKARNAVPKFEFDINSNANSEAQENKAEETAPAVVDESAKKSPQVAVEQKVEAPAEEKKQEKEETAALAPAPAPAPPVEQQPPQQVYQTYAPRQAQYQPQW